MLSATKCPSCRDPRLSVFVGGDIGDLTHGELESWLRGQTDVKFYHIYKSLKNTYGHVHFKNEDDAGIFYHSMVGKTFKGPRDCEIRFKASTLYSTSKLVDYKLPTETQLLLPFVALPSVNQKRNEDGLLIDQNVNEASTPLRDRDGKKALSQGKRSDAESSSFDGGESLQKKQRGEANSSLRQAFFDSEEVRQFPRKRRAEESPDGLPTLLKEEVLYRIYEDSMTYTVLVHTSTIDESQTGLDVTYCDCVLSLVWKFTYEEISGNIVDNNIPDGLSIDIVLQKSIDSKSIIIDVKNGVTKLVLKKLGKVLILDGRNDGV